MKDGINKFRASKEKTMVQECRRSKEEDKAASNIFVPGNDIQTLWDLHCFMTRLNLYQEYSGGEQQEPTNQSSTINNDDVDNTEAPASVENVNVFTSDPSLPEDPCCNCTCIQGPPTQGCCNQERCECIDYFCFACNFSAENALDVDNSPEQASYTLPALPIGEGTLATLRRARENPQLARIAEQLFQLARAQQVPPRRLEELEYGEDGLAVPIEELLSRVARAPDSSRYHRRYTDPEDREPPEEWDDVCLMNPRRALSSAGHHADLPHPAITPEPSNTEEPSNISPGRRFEILWSGRAIQNVDNMRLDKAALDPRVRRASSANRPRPQINRQAQQEYHGSMADSLDERGPPRRRRSPGPEILDRSSAPLCEQSRAEIARAGLRDARPEFRRNVDSEESDNSSSETLSDNASEHRPEKRRRTSYFGEKE